MISRDTRSALPSVYQVAESLGDLRGEFPDALITRFAREALERARHGMTAGQAAPSMHDLATEINARLRLLQTASLRRVINATGVILHTNLGRAPLGYAPPVTGYSNLEYDLAEGRRGQRDHRIKHLLEILLDRPAIAVNNGAAAAFLALNELAAGFEVIVSRGELIEIGDGFRIPDILTKSGAVLREVGTTNRTTLADYRDAINERTRLLLRVHASNFQISGFTAKPALAELAALAQERSIPLYEDLGSGNLLDLKPFGVAEPLVTDSLAAGVNLVSFSGDKLLGGPQSGLLAGDRGLIDRLRRNPLYRALRLDKLVCQSLEWTLLQWCLGKLDDIPALRMIRLSADEIRERATRLFPEIELIPGESVIGGGSTPNQSLPTTLVVIGKGSAVASERRLRAHDPPVIARISGDQLLLDLRTVFEEDEPALHSAVNQLAE